MTAVETRRRRPEIASVGAMPTSLDARTPVIAFQVAPGSVAGTTDAGMSVLTSAVRRAKAAIRIPAGVRVNAFQIARESNVGRG